MFLPIAYLTPFCLLGSFAHIFPDGRVRRRSHHCGIGIDIGIALVH